MLTERQKDQALVESMRTANLEAANASGPAVQSETAWGIEWGKPGVVPVESLGRDA